MAQCSRCPNVLCHALVVNGHTKVAGKQVLRKGLSPLATTLSIPTGAAVIAGIRLRAGRAGSGKGAASMVTDAINLARAAGAVGEVLVCGDSAYGHSALVRACQRAGARFSLVLVKNSTLTNAIQTIPDDAWTPVHYPGAVPDPETGEWISDAEVAEIPTFTAFASTPHPVTARLIVRRVRDRARLAERFPVWRHHPFLTDNTESALAADITHRRPVLHLPAHWPWAGLAHLVGQHPRTGATTSDPRLKPAHAARSPRNPQWKCWADQRAPPVHPRPSNRS